MNSNTPSKTNELTFPKEFACNPSLTAEVLINFMRESLMLHSLSSTLGCSKNRFTGRLNIPWENLVPKRIRFLAMLSCILKFSNVKSVPSIVFHILPRIHLVHDKEKHVYFLEH
jgi:hypothetical protein